MRRRRSAISRVAVARCAAERPPASSDSHACRFSLSRRSIVGRFAGMRYWIFCFAWGSAVEMRIVRSNGSFWACTSFRILTASPPA